MGNTCHSESNNENKEKEMLFQLRSGTPGKGIVKKYCDIICFMKSQQFKAVKILQSVSNCYYL